MAAVGAGIACLAAGCGGFARGPDVVMHPLSLGVVNRKSGEGGVVCAASPLARDLYTWMITLAPQGTTVDISALQTPPPYYAVDAVAAVNPGVQNEIAPYAVRLGPALKVNSALLAAAPPGAMRLGVAMAGTRFTEATIWLPLLFDPLVVLYRPDLLSRAQISMPQRGWTFRDLFDHLMTLRARGIARTPLALMGAATDLTAVIAGRRRGSLPWLPTHAFWVAAPDALLLALAHAYGISLLPTNASLWASSRFADACALWISLMDMSSSVASSKCTSPFAGWTAAFQFGFLSDALAMPKGGHPWAMAPAPAGPAGRVTPAGIAGMCVLRQRSVAQALSVYERILLGEQAGAAGATNVGLPLFPLAAASILRDRFGVSDAEAKVIGDVQSCIRVNTELIPPRQSDATGKTFPPPEAMAYTAGVGNIAMVTASARSRKELDTGLLLAAEATRNAMGSQTGRVGGTRSHVHCAPDGSCYLM